MPTTTLNVDTRHTFLAAFFAQCGTRSGLKLFIQTPLLAGSCCVSLFQCSCYCVGISVSCRITRVTVKGSPETYSTSAVMLLLCLFMSFFFLVHAVSFDRQYNRTFKNLTRIHWHTCVLLPTNTGHVLSNPTISGQRYLFCYLEGTNYILICSHQIPCFIIHPKIIFINTQLRSSV